MNQYIISISIIGLLFLGCAKPKRLEDIKAQGKIIVLTRNAPTTYYENNYGDLVGIEYELAKSFAKHLGVQAEFVVLNSTNEILKALKNGDGDLAAAGLAYTNKRAKNFLLGPPYQTIQQEVVCNKMFSINNRNDLSKIKIAVIKNSNYEDRLKKIPKLQIELISDLSTEELLEEVSKKNKECTVANSNILSIQKRYFTNLFSVYSLENEEQLVWAFPKSYKFLNKELKKWYSNIQKSSLLSALIDKYYGHTEEFNYLDRKIFLEKAKSTLPKYQGLFKMAGDKYKIPWKLLAALSYQESHWNPNAESPTGVKGIMMLTQSTAKEMDVKDRRDPFQSIVGGAKYLKQTIDQIPPYIDGDDRIWMGLASYNVGYSHLRDARSLAVLKEKNPNRWAGVKEMLPLLSNNKYYRHLPHGYARGHEPVLFVQRIRNYLELLK